MTLSCFVFTAWCRLASVCVDVGSGQKENLSLDLGNKLINRASAINSRDTTAQCLQPCLMARSTAPAECRFVVTGSPFEKCLELFVVAAASQGRASPRSGFLPACEVAQAVRELVSKHR